MDRVSINWIMDPTGRGNTNAGRICGMIGTLLVAVPMVLAMAAAVLGIVLRVSAVERRAHAIPEFRPAQPEWVAPANPHAPMPAIPGRSGGRN